MCLFAVRAKYHKLKYGTELNQGEIKPPNYDSGETDVSIPVSQQLLHSISRSFSSSCDSNEREDEPDEQVWFGSLLSSHPSECVLRWSSL